MKRKPHVSVLVLNGSLKHRPETSHTEELARSVLGSMRSQAVLHAEVVRLSDLHIPPGVRLKESDDDDWPLVAQMIIDADVVLFATPIWWGARSSLLQRVIERMDSFDEMSKSGRDALAGKVAGVVITGSEDGAQATLGGILEVLTFMNFTIPPKCCAYWVGEVGKPERTAAVRRRANAATKKMAVAAAQNLIAHAVLLKKYSEQKK